MINKSPFYETFFTVNWVSYQIPPERIQDERYQLCSLCRSQLVVLFYGEEGVGFDTLFCSTSNFSRVKYSKVNCHPGIGKSSLLDLPFHDLQLGFSSIDRC